MAEYLEAQHQAEQYAVHRHISVTLVFADGSRDEYAHVFHIYVLDSEVAKLGGADEGVVFRVNVKKWLLKCGQR